MLPSTVSKITLSSAFQIQRQQFGEDLIITERRVPAVGGNHRRVQPFMRVVKAIDGVRGLARHSCRSLYNSVRVLDKLVFKYSRMVCK